MRFLALSCLLVVAATTVSAKYNPKKENLEQKSISSEAAEENAPKFKPFLAESQSSGSVSSSTSTGPRPITAAEAEAALLSIQKYNSPNGQSSFGSQSFGGQQGQSFFSQPSQQSFSSFQQSNNYNGAPIQGAVVSRRTVTYQPSPVKQAQVLPPKFIEVGPNQNGLNLFFNSRSNAEFDVFNQKKPTAGRPETSVFYSTTAQEKPLQFVQSIQNPTVREYAQFFRPVSYTTQVVGPVREQVHTIVHTSGGQPATVQQVQGQTGQQAQFQQTAAFQTVQQPQNQQSFFAQNLNSNGNNNAFNNLGQQTQSSFQVQSENQIVSPAYPAFDIPAPKPFDAFKQTVGNSQVKVVNTNKNPWEAAREILGEFSSLNVQSKPVIFNKPASQNSFSTSSSSTSSGQNQFKTNFGNSQLGSASASSSASTLFSPSIQQVLNKFPAQNSFISASSVHTQARPGVAHVIQSPRPGSSSVTRVEYEIPVQQQGQSFPIQSVQQQQQQVIAQQPFQFQQVVQQPQVQRLHLPVQTTRLQQFSQFPIQVPTTRYVQQQQFQQPSSFNTFQTNLVQQQQQHQPAVFQQQVVPATFQQTQYVPQFQTHRTIQIRPLVTETSVISPNTVKQHTTTQTVSHVSKPQNVQSLNQNQNSYLINQQQQHQQVDAQPQASNSVNVATNTYKVVKKPQSTETTVDKVERHYHKETTEENEESSSVSTLTTSYGVPAPAPASEVVPSVEAVPAVEAVPVAEESLPDVSGVGTNTVDESSSVDSTSEESESSKVESGTLYSPQPASVEVPAPVVEAPAPLQGLTPLDSVSSSSTSESRDEESEETSSSTSNESTFRVNQPALPLSPPGEQIQQSYITSEDEDVDSSKKKKK